MRWMLTTLAGIMAIVLLAFVLAYSIPVEQAVPLDVPVYEWPQVNVPSPGSISLAEVKAKIDRGDKPVLLDARPVEEYRAGHIKGAISLPSSQFEQRYLALRDRLAEATEVITYCDGTGCDLGAKLLEALTDKGVSRVKVLSEGWQAWLAAGYPTERGE